MRIALLSRNAALYSTSRLVLAGRARGHDVDVIDPLDLQLVVADGALHLAYAGSALPKYDAVVPRVGASISHYGMKVLRTFDARVVLNNAGSIELARDKVRSLGLLAARKIKVPRTVSVAAATGLSQALALVGGCPAVVKLQHGTQGVGTMIAESRRSLTSIVETLHAMNREVIIQQYIGASRGRDIRALVVGGKAVAAMRRVPGRGEFRSNLHRGGSSQAVDLKTHAAYRRCATKAAKAIGLEVTGVDMLETPDGPVVLELNSSPGLEGIEQASGVDVADHIIRLCEQRS